MNILFLTSTQEEKTEIVGPSIRICLHGNAKTAGEFVWKLVTKMIDRQSSNF